MRKLLLSLLLLAGAILPASAQQRTEAEALAIAKAFMQNNGYDFKVTKSARINKVRAEKAGDITPKGDDKKTHARFKSQLPHIRIPFLHK